MTTASPAPLPRRRLGTREVTAIGLGCMPLSQARMADRRDDAVALVHEALDSGVRLLDTANIYAPSWDTVGHNESLVGTALRTWSGPTHEVTVVTKGGITRGPGETWGRHGGADAMRRAAEASLTRLGGDRLAVYLLHRHDPDRPWLEQVRALASVQAEGLAESIGLSNVTPAELDVALAELGGPGDGGVVAVQNEFSPAFRVDASIVSTCAARGIAFMTWSPLTGAADSAAFTTVADELGVSPQRVALAWLLGLSPTTLVIPGSTRSQTLLDSLAAATVELTDEQREVLDASPSADVSLYPDDSPRAPLP